MGHYDSCYEADANQIETDRSKRLKKISKFIDSDLLDDIGLDYKELLQFVELLRKITNQ